MLLYIIIGTYLIMTLYIVIYIYVYVLYKCTVHPYVLYIEHIINIVIHIDMIFINGYMYYINVLFIAFDNYLSIFTS